MKYRKNSIITMIMTAIVIMMVLVILMIIKLLMLTMMINTDQTTGFIWRLRLKEGGC